MADPSRLPFAPLNAAAHDIFSLENEDTIAQLQLRRLVQEKLEAQYRRWQDHEQHLWREAITSRSTQSILGLDKARTLPLLRRNIINNTLGLSLLSELDLCSVRPSIVRSYESRRNVEAAQWLHHQYRRYAIRIKEFEERQKQYSIPLLDLTVLVGTDHLLFEQRNKEDASKLLPPASSSRRFGRFVLFPQTRYAFIEDEVFQPLFPIDEEQFRLMSYELLPYFRGAAGFYNALSSPFTHCFSQPSYDGIEFRYFAAMYPVVNFESLADYEIRKASETATISMQKYGSSGLPAIARARYARRFDFPKELTLSRQDYENEEDGPERIQSGRALYEFACGDVDTLALDQKQISILEGSERHPSQPPHLLTIEPLWIIAFPSNDTLCAFYDNARDGKPEALSTRIANRAEGEKEQDWARTLIQLIEAADQFMGRYEPIYRVWLAKLRIKLQASQSIEPSLVRKLSDFVAEITILLDPLQKQIVILESWMTLIINFDKRMYEMVHEAIDSRKSHLELVQRLLQQGKDTQALLFQLSNIETSYLQSELAKKMARETELQSKLAKHAQRQNKSILTFTIITVIFLPLSFFTSYFGMNTRDIRETRVGQTGFWVVAAPVSFFVILSALLIAFRVPILKWHQVRKGGQRDGQSAQKQNSELGDGLEGV